ncbi:hypothetical protein AVEN_275402-1 [Araneus ventricosus]|uniref:Uncharacterized protein n=1 Tax=Araneus ventricosus TaxID=182803 RepID=A0A4Y2PLU8_ARAVE|nr:hypothetical protein AVEN_275402-1 [Araneus ventricosus]
MLQHLQLVWVLLVSQQIANDPALTDFHWRRDVGSLSSDSWPSLPAPVLTYLHLLPFLVFIFACMGVGIRPFEFHDKFYHDVMGYLYSLHCIQGCQIKIAK